MIHPRKHATTYPLRPPPSRRTTLLVCLLPISPLLPPRLPVTSPPYCRSLASPLPRISIAAAWHPYHRILKIPTPQACTTIFVAKKPPYLPSGHFCSLRWGGGNCGCRRGRVAGNEESEIERAADGQLEVSKPHLVEEEAARQPAGRGCVAHSWWRRRPHASEVGPTTPEEGGRLLDRTQPYCQIWPRGGYHCQEEEIATNLYRAHTPRIDALDPATGSHLEEEATSSPHRASSPSLDPDAMLRPHGKRGRTREENVTALPMPPSGRSRQRRGKTRAPAVELKSRYDAVYGEKRSTTSSFFYHDFLFCYRKKKCCHMGLPSSSYGVAGPNLPACKKSSNLHYIPSVSNHR